jgi:hypothetical protein
MPTGSDGRIGHALWRERTWLLHHDNAPPHTSVLTHQFLAKNKMAVIPHPPYPLNWHPVISSHFQKMKLKLKGRRFENIEEIQAESQRVFDTLIEKNSRKRSKNGGESGTGVYMQEGTTSRVTVADRPYGEFYDFYSVSLENFV